MKQPKKGRGLTARPGVRALITVGALALGSRVALPAPVPAALSPENPFYAPSTLPFQAPPFDKIKNGDYQPAIDAGMEQQQEEVQRIAANSAPPTFENTIVALEKSGRLFDRAMNAFNCVTGANIDPELQKIQQYEAPRLAAHHDAIYLNRKLFARVRAIHQKRKSLGLDPESLRLVDYYYKAFVHAGARLSVADQAKLKKLNEEESTLSNDFVTRLLAATKAAAYSTQDPKALDGLSPAQLAAARQSAEERKQPGWVIPLQNTTQQPDLAVLTDRSTREAIFRNSWNRTEQGGPGDTRAVISRLAQLRAEKAKLLGYPDFASWALVNQMAKTPQAAIRFMNELVPASTAKAREEAARIQALIDAQKGDFQLEPWDWNFYAEQIRQKEYGLDDAQLKPYFELNTVLKDGVFYAAHELYGLTFKERHDIPVYAPDVRVFEVFDANQKPLALFYCDYFKRDNKNGGAWMDNLVVQSRLLGTLPVVYNVANFSKPAPGKPALLSFDDVTTMFHEFGHALHGMFADTEYPSLSGTAVARDFVEFPSQFNEHWATYAKVFDHYAKNYETGKPMPAAMAEKLRQSHTFNQGYELTELLAAAELDMQWHTLPVSTALENPDVFGPEALKRTHLDLAEVPPRYRSSYFAHIWGGGYAAGYYSYLWSEMLDDDAFQWFEDHGGLTRANGDRFRRMVLSKGNTEDLEKMYDAWLGAKPDIKPMLKYRGLTQK